MHERDDRRINRRRSIGANRAQEGRVTVFILAEAEADLDHAHHHDEQKQAGPGGDFLLSFQDAIRRITKFPEA
jgi:hypothetical protein